MTKEWIIGNLKKDEADELVSRILDKDTAALNKARHISWSALVREYGDKESDRAFSLGDYRMYLFNKYLEDDRRKL